MAECENIRELISEMMDRELSAAEREAVAAHCEECAECREFYEITRSLAGIMPEDVEPPEELLSAVMEGVRGINAERKRKRRVVWLKWTAAAACAVLVIGAGRLAIRNGAPKSAETASGERGFAKESAAEVTTDSIEEVEEYDTSLYAMENSDEDMPYDLSVSNAIAQAAGGSESMAALEDDTYFTEGFAEGEYFPEEALEAPMAMSAAAPESADAEPWLYDISLVDDYGAVYYVTAEVPEGIWAQYRFDDGESVGAEMTRTEAEKLLSELGAEFDLVENDPDSETAIVVFREKSGG